MPRDNDLVQHQSKPSSVSQALPEEYTARSETIPRRPQGDSVLASFAQERLWFLHELDPDSPAYNIARAARLSGSLNTVALERSLNELAQRHESLRTTFRAVDGHPVQAIAPDLSLSLELVDLQTLPESRREEEARQLVAHEARRPFDLSQGPLFRPTLFRLDDRTHILLLVMHHIVSDGWSMAVLLREISALYQAFAASRPSPLHKLPIQYADYALWQQEWFQGKVLESQLAYWQQQLAGAPLVLELPTDHPHRRTQSFQGAVKSATISKGLTRKLRALSLQEGVTLFMTLLATFQVLLQRYTGQVDIVVGSPIANRTRAEFEGLVGFFVNTVVLRTDLSGNPTFRELLGRVRQGCLGAYAHQDLPFEKLVKTLQPVREADHTPLFQTMLVLQNTPPQNLELPGLQASPLDLDAGAAQFDLTLMLVNEGDGLQAKVAYRTELFEAQTIERMLGHFETLLQGIVSDPSQRIAELPLLTDAEQHQLLATWNDTRVDFGPDLCLHQLFEREVERSPDAVALVSGEQQLTYSQLNTRANQLARYLLGLGAGPEMLIGLFLERSVERVVAMLGILKAGAAFVSLDPAHPREDLARKAQDAQMSVYVTTQALLDRLPDGTIRAVSVDAEQRAIALESEQNPGSRVATTNLACIIYTSGSTGQPKGVMIDHAGMHNFLLGWYHCCDMGPHTRRLDSTSLSYDVWIAGIAIPLCCGGVVQIATDDALLPGPELIQFLEETGVSQLAMLPSALRLLPTAELPSLQVVITGGEVVTADIARRWATGRVLINGYGITETTINTTVYQCSAGDEAPPIGRPMANMLVYLLDPHLHPVPVGIPGEIYIGGASLARGYLNQPGRTAEKFIPNPFGVEPGERLYRTGDLARYLPDGNIQFLGRIDHQVKIRGFRVEPEEVDAVLGQHPDVREAAVLAEESTPGENQLVAYVVPEGDDTPLPGDLRRFLRERLPGHMIPSAFVALETLPLTSSGKLDRGALPAHDWSRPDLVETFIAPRTKVEKVLASVWAQVLGVDQVGIHDNFFDLGGHSLLATQIVSRVDEILHVQIPLRVVFDTPTIAGMAAFINEQQGSVVSAQELEKMMTELEQMPDEEVKGVLQDENSGYPDAFADPEEGSIERTVNKEGQ